MRTGISKWDRQGALTILEMLVSTALLTFIVLGLTAMFIQVQKAFKTGLKTADVTDAGRAVADLIGQDLQQISDAGSPGITNLYWSSVTSSNYVLVQNDANGNPIRTNEIDDIFCLVRVNTTWMGVGYVVSNAVPGVGTLFRYIAMTNAPLQTNSLYNNFIFAVAQNGLSNRVADGVIHMKLRASDKNGNLVDTNDFSYPNHSTNLPVSVELELGILEPDTIEQAKSMSGNSTAQETFLANATGKVHIFRENILLPTATR